MIEKEPITVILSQRGWIRAMKGHVALDEVETLKFARATGRASIFHAQTTDKLLLAADNGRVYTLGGDKLPGGRGFGEPVRLTDRPRGGERDRRADGGEAGDAAAGRVERRARVRDQRRGDAGRDAQGQAAGQPAARREGRGGAADRRRTPTRSR